jgi:hypothetical protein
MKRILSFYHLFKNGFVWMIVTLLFGCSGRMPWFGSSEKGFVMQYRFPSNQTLDYETTFTQRSTVERGGQSDEYGSRAAAHFSIKGSGTDPSGNQSIEIRILDLEGVVQEPERENTVNVASVVGIPFSMDMSRTGRIHGFHGTDPLEIRMEMDGPGRNNVKHFFQYYGGDFFPLLPDTPYKIGDSWNLHDQRIDEIAGFQLTTHSDSKYTIIGFEKIQGHSCLKVTVETTGTMEGTSYEDQRTLEGDLESSGIYHWDYQKGMLRKYSYDYFLEATLAEINSGAKSYTLENKMEIVKTE